MTSPARFFLCAAFVLAFAPGAWAQTITEFPLPPGGSPYGITAGPDGNLWYGNPSFPTALPKIGRITPAGAVTEFEQYPDPLYVASGPDGNLWFTASDPGNNAANIVRVTPAGVRTSFQQTSGRYFGGIAGGSDGNLWCAWSTGAFVFTLGISRITPAGAHIDFPLPNIQSQAGGITAGPDGALWFVAPETDRVVRMTTAGVVTQFALTAGSEPSFIVAGPDGNLWFTESAGNKIGRITTAGVVTEFPVPTIASSPKGIAVGPDGNIWFTESAGNKIGRITTAGVITEFPVPTSASSPFGITAGPDDALWFTEAAGNRIGRITTGIVPDTTQILPVVGSTAGVGTSFFRTSVQLHNAGTTPSTGRIVFYPSGTSGSGTEPGLNFTLAPGQTQTIPDLLPAMGTSGLGSADLALTLGSAGNIPIVSARVFNDAGTAGTTGFALNALNADEALRAGRRGVLTIPLDLTNFRMNIGVRTLAAPVLLTVTVRDATGAVSAVVPKFFLSTYHEQQSATAFLNGLPLPAGGSITALVESGSAIVYGATVDNRTGDPSLQIAAPAP